MPLSPIWGFHNPSALVVEDPASKHLHMHDAQAVEELCAIGKRNTEWLLRSTTCETTATETQKESKGIYIQLPSEISFSPYRSLQTHPKIQTQNPMNPPPTPTMHFLPILTLAFVGLAAAGALPAELSTDAVSSGPSLSLIAGSCCR